MSTKWVLSVVLVFYSCVSIANNIKYKLDLVREDVQGNKYLVIQVSLVGAKRNDPKHPYIVRLKPNGDVDPSFGTKGVVSLKNWQDWHQVKVADLKISDGGELTVLGEMGSREFFEPSRPADAAWQDQMLADAKGKDDKTSVYLEHIAKDAEAFFRTQVEQRAHGTDGTNKVFISKFNPSGQPVKSWGEGGTATISNVLNHYEDNVKSFFIRSDGSVLYLAENYKVIDDVFHEITVVGRVRANGEVDESFGEKGRVRLDDKAIPAPKGMKRDHLSPLAIVEDEKGIHVVGVRQRFAKKSKEEWKPDIPAKEVIQRITLAENGKGGVQADQELARLTPKSDEFEFKIFARTSEDGKKIYVVHRNYPSQKVSIRTYDQQGNRIAGPVVFPGRSVDPIFDIQVDDQGDLVLFRESKACDGSMCRTKINGETLAVISNQRTPDITEPFSPNRRRVQCSHRFQKLSEPGP